MRDEYLHIERFAISYVWFAAILAFLLLLGSIWLLLRMCPPEWILNSFILYVVIWKFSYALFHISYVIDMPASLFFFHGGYRGQFLALFGLLMYWNKVVSNSFKRHLPYFVVLYLIQFEMLLAAIYQNLSLLLVNLLFLIILLFVHHQASTITFEWILVLFLLYLIATHLVEPFDEKQILFQLVFISTAYFPIRFRKGGTHPDASP